jgi:hypothetical protein
MANTKTNTTLLAGNKRAIIYYTLAYVDAQETDAVVFDSSVIAALVGITDPLNCTLETVDALVAGPVAVRAFLEFDATTDVLALSLPVNIDIQKDFRKIGGLKNTAGTGITGDITLTTLGLDAGSTITLVLNVRLN